MDQNEKLDLILIELKRVRKELKEVNEDLSNKNTRLRKENRDLEESLDKAKQGISKIIKRYKN